MNYNNNEILKLRVGLIIDSPKCHAFLFNLCKWIISNEILAAPTLIIQETSESGLGLKFFHIILLYKLIVYFESRLLKKYKKLRSHCSKYDLLKTSNKAIRVKPIISEPDLIYRYNDYDIKKIKQENLDLLLHYGSGTLRGDILNVARFGIISLQHNDKIEHSAPTGFWEVFNKEDRTKFSIRRLTEEPNDGNILYKGYFDTKYFYLLNQANLYIKSNFYIQKIILETAASKKAPTVLEIPSTPEKPRTRPTSPDLIRYLLKLIYILLQKTAKNFLKKQEKWTVAYSRTGWRNLVMQNAITIENPSTGFLADPFVITHNDKHYCFVEEYDNKLRRGHISLYELNETQATPLGTIIKEPFHMSYPYVFEYQSKYYMVPETSGNRDIRLYEATEFPTKWRFHKKLLDNIDATDTTIFEKNGLWWLFTNIDPVDSGNHSSELFIFYAEDPLSEKWTAHPLNPVICDPLTGRMGGLLFDNNGIYRVSQQAKFDRYGHSSNVNKIKTLSTTDYLEELELTIKPNFFKNLIATHHLHSNNRVTVFDFMKKSN